MDEIIIRDWDPSNIQEEGFLYNSWETQCRQHAYFTIGMSNDIFYPWHHKVIERILKRPTTKVRVMALADDTSIIIGYLVSEALDESTFILHFCYIKGAFRNIGLAKKLVKDASIDLAKKNYASQYTRRAAWVFTKYPELIYNIYLI